MGKTKFADENMRGFIGAINSGEVVVDDPARLDVSILDGVEKDIHKKVSMNEFGETSVSRLSLDELEQARRDVIQVNEVAKMAKEAELDAVRSDYDKIMKKLEEYNM